MNVNSDEIRILACQPVDLTRLRNMGLPVHELAPITDLYRREECEACYAPIWVGPRQASMREIYSREVATLCLFCAMIASRVIGDRERPNFVSLGGGYGVEGKARTSTGPQSGDALNTFVDLDLDESDFPFTVEAFRTDTKEVLWSATVDGPGALQIPGYGDQDFTVSIRVTYPNGKIEVF